MIWLPRRVMRGGFKPPCGLPSPISAPPYVVPAPRVPTPRVPTPRVPTPRVPTPRVLAPRVLAAPPCVLAAPPCVLLGRTTLAPPSALDQLQKERLVKLEKLEQRLNELQELIDQKKINPEEDDLLCYLMKFLKKKFVRKVIKYVLVYIAGRLVLDVAIPTAFQGIDLSFPGWYLGLTSALLGSFELDSEQTGLNAYIIFFVKNLLYAIQKGTQLPDLRSFQSKPPDPMDLI